MKPLAAMNASILFKRALLIALASLSLLGLFGQSTPDTLFLHNGRVMSVHVVELGLDEIKYHQPGDDLRVSVERNQVAMVKMADGRTFRTQAPELSVQLRPKAMVKNQTIKFHFFSPAFNHITFGYERVLRPWTNLDLSLGYIGAGIRGNGPDVKGILFRGGVKFLSRPDMLVRGMRLVHPLHGRYVKPELSISSYSERATLYDQVFSSTPSEKPYNRTNLAINVIFGKQRFIGGGATLDTWFGAGYALLVEASESGYRWVRAHEYAHIKLGWNNPLVISAGLTLGVAFGRGGAYAVQ